MNGMLCRALESKRRAGTLAALMAATAGCADEPLTAPPEAPAREQTNLLFVTVDTLRADHLSCYGYARPTSPAIDALAGHGLRFEQALVQWPKTGPSLCSILTSTYPSTNGVLRTTGTHAVPEVYETLAEVFEASGYQTMAVVTNGSLSRALRFDQGFERYEEHFVGADCAAHSICAKAVRLLEERDPGRPWMLWLHFGEPHTPYQPTERWLEAFTEDASYLADTGPAIPLEPRLLGGALPEGQPDDVGTIPRKAYQLGLDRVRDYTVRYDAEIRDLDDKLGQFLAWMNTEGHLQDTAVVFTADHGESLGEHEYYFDHGRFPYDDGLRVPLLLLHPELEAGVVREPFALLDLAPTLAELMDVEEPFQSEGRSRAPSLRPGAAPSPAAPVFSESGYVEDFTVSVRVGADKLIRVNDAHLARQLVGAEDRDSAWPEDGPRYELYDLEHDPSETVNLRDQRPEKFAELRELLDAYWEEARQRVPPDSAAAGELDAAARKSLENLGYVDGK